MLINLPSNPPCNGTTIAPMTMNMSPNSFCSYPQTSLTNSGNVNSKPAKLKAEKKARRNRGVSGDFNEDLRNSSRGDTHSCADSVSSLIDSGRITSTKKKVSNDRPPATKKGIS